MTPNTNPNGEYFSRLSTVVEVNLNGFGEYFLLGYG